MSTELPTRVDHLPERKQAQLRAITALIRNTAPSAEMVILFGSYARGDWVEDLATGYFSDFDLLVVLGNPGEAKNLTLWQRITREAHRITGHVSVNLLPLHYKEINSEIRVGHYFFADVVAEGIALFDSRKISLAKPKAKTPRERLTLAEFNFKYWYESAGGFWIGTGYYMSLGMRCHAAFLLHQSVERYYHAVLLVFKGTKPKCHNIERLAEDTASLHEALAGAMPRKAGEEKRLFGLLKRAYIEARYSKSYRITLEELKALRGQVHDLAERVRSACRDQLSTIVDPEAVSELPAPPDAADTDAFPPPPDLDDAETMDQWKQAIAEMCEARGLARGREEGIAQGRKEGLREGEARGMERGREEGLREGEARGRRRLMKQLEHRFGPLPPEREAEIACASPEDLDTWAERLLTADSLDDVFRQ